MPPVFELVRQSGQTGALRLHIKGKVDLLVQTVWDI